MIDTLYRRYYEASPPHPFTSLRGFGQAWHLYKITLRLTDEIPREAWMKKRHSIYKPQVSIKCLNVFII